MNVTTEPYPSAAPQRRASSAVGLPSHRLYKCVSKWATVLLSVVALPVVAVCAFRSLGE